MEWSKIREAATMKTKTRPSAEKVLCSVSWDMQGVIFADFVHERQIVNAAYYLKRLDSVKKAKLGYPSNLVSARPRPLAYICCNPKKMAELG